MITKDGGPLSATKIFDPEGRIYTRYHCFTGGFVTNISLGKLGEKAAAKFLRGLGHRILAQNWRCKLGEVDLITLHEKKLVIVEVKTRRLVVAEGFPPLAAIDTFKQEKLVQLGQFVWDRRSLLFPKQRFRDLRHDAVAITIERFLIFGQRCQIQYLPSFF